MILVDLEKGIISMSGNAITVHAELGIALKKYHELESEHTCKKLADMHVNSLCEMAKLSDEEIEAKNEKIVEGKPWIDELARNFTEEIMKGFKL